MRGITGDESREHWISIFGLFRVTFRSARGKLPIPLRALLDRLSPAITKLSLSSVAILAEKSVADQSLSRELIGDEHVDDTDAKGSGDSGRLLGPARQGNDAIDPMQVFYGQAYHAVI